MEPVIGHEDIRREIAVLAASDEPPHAILFAGPEGVGRKRLALEYALLLNCERQRPADSKSNAPGLFAEDPGAFAEPASLPCGTCRACRQIAAGSHPDVITLAPGDMLCRPRDGDSHAKHPDSRDIRICQVRGMIDLAARYPFEARYRAIIIDPAERMNREASNTLLKTLEEPPGHTVMLLLSAAPEMIIETVVSRCRRINVRPVARAEVEAGLIARGCESALAAQAAAEGRGRPGRAIAFAAEPELMGDRDRLLERCARIAASNTTERFSYAGDLAERFRRDRAAIAIELDVWEAFWEGELRSSGGNAAAGSGDLVALRAVARARADLLAQVLPRPALELMLLSFPSVRLAEADKEAAAAHG